MVSEEEIEAAIRKMVEEKSGNDLDAAIEEFAKDKTDEENIFAAEKFLEIYKVDDEIEITEVHHGDLSKEEYLKKRDERWFGLHYGYWDFPMEEHNGKWSSVRLCCFCGYWHDYLEKGVRTYKSILLPKSSIECPICLQIPEDIPSEVFQDGYYDCSNCEKTFHTYERDIFCFTCLAEVDALGHGKKWILDTETGGSMTVAKLKSVLKEKGLSNKGKKAELVKRLNDFNKSSN